MDEQTAIIVGTLAGFFFLSMLFKGSKGKDVAREIGDVLCQRCGHTGQASSKTRFKPGAGVQTSFTCQRCGSEDWRAA